MKLSIIVPCYNSENIVRCLDSIVNQTFKDFEIVIVDDGSSDKTYEIINSYFIDKEDIDKQIIKQDNLGSSLARKAGIEKARGDYLGFVDSDDYIEEDYYERLMNKAIESNSDIVCCGIIRHENGKIIKVPSNNQYTNIDISGKQAEMLILNNKSVLIYLVNKVFKKELFKNSLNYPGRIIAEDYLLLSQILKHTDKVSIIDSYGYHYLVSLSSQTKQKYSDVHKQTYIEYNDYYLNIDDNDSDYKQAFERL